MGYAIKDISELEVFDFTTTDCLKETVRKSVNGSKFIINGSDINDYSLEEIRIIVDSSEWDYNK